MSLKARISFLSVGLLLLLLLAGTGIEYLALGAYLRHDEAAVLKQRFNQSIQGVDVKGVPCRVGTRATVPLVAGSVNPVRAQCIANALGGPNVSAQVLDSGGHVLAAAGAGSPSQLTPADYAGAARPRDYYITGASTDQAIAVLQPLRLRGRVVGAVQLTEPTTLLQTTQQRLLTVLGLAALGVALLAALLTPVLVSRALRPLRRVTEASTALAAGDLDRRVLAPAARDEVGRLARAFNEMAAAVQRALHIRAESEAGMRTFVSDASHELRTPLTTLQGQLDVLGRGAAGDPDQVRASLASMQREVTRMSALVEDLLTLTRLDSPGTDGRRGPVDLDALVAETVDEQSVKSPGQRVVVEQDPAGPAMVSGDREQLRRVVENLATNAAKYAPGGVHRWRTRREGDCVILSLSDEGPGLAPESLPRVFDRFYRGAAEGGGTPGSGLGLAIVRSVVEAHGGRVEAGGGPGATFTVRLPALEVPTAT